MGYMVGVCSLEINSCSPEDAGKYVCCASNALGKADTSCRIVVHGKPAVAIITHYTT